MAFEGYLTLTRRVLARYHIEERGFPRAVWSDDGVSLTLLQFQVDPEEHFESAEIFRKIRYFQERHGRFPLAVLSEGKQRLQPGGN